MIKLKSLSKKAGFLAAVAGAAVIGGATTAIVTAAIPSSTDGKIHGCYRTGASPNAPSGDLRVIDTEANQTCTAQETSVNWPATTSANSQEAYAFVKRDPNSSGNWILDPSRTKNVTSMTYVPSQNNGENNELFGGFCFTLPFTPKNIQATKEIEDDDGINYTIVSVRDESGTWSNIGAITGGTHDPAAICENAPTANAIVEFELPTQYFVKFEN